MDLLSTSGINNLVYSYKSTEYNRRIYPLETKKQKFSNLSSEWGSLKSKLTTFKSTLSGLKDATNTTLFNSKSVEVSNSNFLTATATKSSSASAYSLRINQLAKSDLLVSATQTSSTAVTTLAGKHTIQIQSGDYTANVDIELTDSETNESIMEKLSSAINTDKAVVNSDSFVATDSFSGAGSFDIEINGTTKTISYDYSAGSKTYDEVMDDLVTQINNDVSGVAAEKVVDDVTGDVSLKVTVEDSKNSISISSSDFLNMDVTDEKGGSGISVASIFTPSSGNSKFSISAKESGYDNRLILSDTSGSILNQIGLTSGILTGRTMAADDNAAGYMYSANSSIDNELNSKLVFNGVNIQRNSNTVDDIVSGVTFNLKSVMDAGDQDVSVSVSVNTESIKEEIDKFIKDFNDVYKYVRGNSESEDSRRGIFRGDSSAQSLLNTFQNTAMGKVTGLADDHFAYLSEIGIKFDPVNGLSISDSTKLETSIKEKPSQVANLFNSDNGLANTLYTTVDNFTKNGGVIDNLVKSYDDNVTYYSDRIEASNKSIDKGAEILRKKYEDLQGQLLTLINSANYLNSMGGGFF